MRRGWTLTELLIAVAIVAIIALFSWLGVKGQIFRGYDARRKTDLSLISKAFEEYYNDKGCYPSSGIIDTCAGSELMPYLDKIPCDPTTKTRYLYVPEDDPCDGQRVCAKLQDKSDPAIRKMGCDPDEGCGWGAGYNFCLGAGVAITAPGFVPGGAGTPTPTPTPGGGGGPTPTPTPTPTGAPTSTPTPTATPGPTPTSTPTPTPTPGGSGPGFACTPGGDCNSYADPGGAGCPIWWQGGCPAGACDNPANRCQF